MVVRGGSSFSVRGEGGGFGLKFDKQMFHCKGVEGPAPGEIFDLQRFCHANLRHIGHCFSLSISPNHKETPKKTLKKVMIFF